MPRLAYEDTSGFPKADVLEAGSRKKPIPRIYRLQPSFLAFVESTGIDAAKHFDKAQNIERLLRE